MQPATDDPLANVSAEEWRRLNPWPWVDQPEGVDFDITKTGW